MRLTSTTILAIAIALSGCAGHNQGPLPQTSGGRQMNAPHAQNEAVETSGYTITALPMLDGGTIAGGNSINNRAWVSGFALDGSGNVRAALWRNGGATDLGTLGGQNSGVEWPVHNDLGLVAGISETATPDPLGENFSCAGFIPLNGHTCLGFEWRDNHMTKLPTLGGNNGFATGANEWGQVVGWAETNKRDATCVYPQQLQFLAVVWEPGSLKPRVLQPYPGDEDSAATAINDLGQVVGISGRCDQAIGRYSAIHMVLWQPDGTIVNIPTLNGDSWNTPMAINDRGQVAGFANINGTPSGQFNPEAFFWTKNGGTTKLGFLPGDNQSQGLGVNDRGQIVGLSNNATSSRAFIYEDGHMTDLNALNASNPSLYLTFANDVNDRGQIGGGACVLAATTCPVGAVSPAFLATPASTFGFTVSAAAPRHVTFAPGLLQLVRKRAAAGSGGF